MTFRTSVGVDHQIFKEVRFDPTTTNAGVGTNGTAIEAFSANLNLLNENYFNYNKSFGKLTFSALLGASFQNNQGETLFARGENFPGNTVQTLNASSIKRDVSSFKTEWGINSSSLV